MTRTVKFLTLLSVLLLMAAMAQAKTVKRYSIETGMIEYEGNGGGNILGVVSETKGSNTLYFKNYGAVTLEEQETTTTMSGMVSKEDKAHTMKKIDNVIVYIVDFERKKIKKGIDPIGSQYLASGKNMSADSDTQLQKMGGQKIGTEKVLGYPCEVWSIEVMGIKSGMVAVKATFNKSVPDSKFQLPDYKIEVLPDYVSEGQALQQGEDMNELGALMGDMQAQMNANPNMTEAEQTAMMIQAMGNSNQGKSQLQQQKDQLPKMLQVMKYMETCLSNASSQADADRCEKESSRLAKQLGLNNDEFSDDEDPLVWNKNTKQQVLSELKEGIQSMEQVMPCIEKAQNMMDMMKCNQGM
jgi:hypothetical protein